MITQGVLPYQYGLEKHATGMTALSGLPTYLDLAHVAGMRESIARHVKVRAGGQGWTDAQRVTSLMLLNLAGGDCVADLEILEKDAGFCEVLGRAESYRLPRKERRAAAVRWRKRRERRVPSPSAVFRYRVAFHAPDQEKLGVPGKAFIPQANEPLEGLHCVNTDLVAFVQSRRAETVATLDMDATLVETQKADARFCYQHYKAYPPLNVYWVEQGLVLHSEFRDGNVPAGYEQLRVFQESLSRLPKGVTQVRLRSDTAGYQHDLLSYCELGKNTRFGRISFAVGCDVTPEFKRAVREVAAGDWRPMYREVDGKKVKTGREWAEVCFVPSGMGHSKNGPVYRYRATREALAQPSLPGLAAQPSLPFPTLTLKKTDYKVFGVVTNDWESDGDAIIHGLQGRCGKSEEAHAVMKEDFAGAKLPSGDFGANAAWWAIMILTLNLNAAMKRLVLKEGWIAKRMKAIRFALINLPGRVLHHSRQLILRLAANHPSFATLIQMRQQILQLAGGPSG